MLINGDEYDIFDKAERMLHTDYKIMKLRENPLEYLIFRESMISLVEDLVYALEELKQEMNNE